MSKFIFGLILGLSFVASTVFALSTFIVPQGGTGAATLTGGQVLYGNGMGIVGTAATGTLQASTGITITAGASIIAGGTITIAGVNAIANSATKGVSTFTTNDFNDNGSGLISLDYTNGQAASASQNGFLSSTDWSTFNNKPPFPFTNATYGPLAASATTTVMNFSAFVAASSTEGNIQVGNLTASSSVKVPLTGVLQGNGVASNVTAVTDSSTVGQVLRVTGASTYGWGALSLSTAAAITGTLPVGNGGTNSASLSSSNTLLYWNGASIISTTTAPLYISSLNSTSTTLMSGFGATSTPWGLLSVNDPGGTNLFAIGSSTQNIVHVGKDMAFMHDANVGYTTASSSAVAATYTVNWSLGATQRFIINQSTNFVINSTSSNPVDGGRYVLKICQDPTGSRVVTFVTPGQLRWWNGTTTISSAANTCSFLGLMYDLRSAQYDVVASSTGVLIQ